MRAPEWLCSQRSPSTCSQPAQVCQQHLWCLAIHEEYLHTEACLCLGHYTGAMRCAGSLKSACSCSETL